MSVSVIKRATASDLSTLPHVCDDLGITPSEQQERQIERWISTASSRVAAFCRRQFAVEKVREEVCLRDTSADAGILLDRWPIAKIDSVIVDGVVLTPSDYESDDRRIYRSRTGARTRWRGRNLLVVYEAGWHLPSEGKSPPEGVAALPAEIEHAIALLVAGPLYSAGRDVALKSEDIEGVGSSSYYIQGANAALPHPDAEAILAPYRRARVG